MPNLFRNRKFLIILIASIVTVSILALIVFSSTNNSKQKAKNNEVEAVDERTALKQLNQFVADKRIDSFGKGTIFEKFPELIKFQLDSTRYVIKMSSGMLFDSRYTKLLEGNATLLDSVRSKGADLPAVYELIFDTKTSSSDNAYGYIRNFQLGYLNGKEIWVYQAEKNFFVSDPEFKNIVKFEMPFEVRDTMVLEAVDTSHFALIDSANIEDKVGIYEFSIETGKKIVIEQQRYFPIDSKKFPTRNDVIDLKVGPIYYEFAPFIKPISKGKYLFVTTAKNGLNFEVYDSAADKFLLLTNYNKPTIGGYNFNCSTVKKKCYLYYDQTGDLTTFVFGDKGTILNQNISNYKELFALIVPPTKQGEQKAFNKVDDYLFIDNGANQVLYATKDGWKKLVDM
jgi:type II secretory pathway pseudopilin PulG